MKKMVLLALAAVIMAGCDGRNVSSVTTDDAKIVIIDSCEYIKNQTHNFLYVYTHKGNCRFCKERREKELKEVVELLKEK